MYKNPPLKSAKNKTLGASVFEKYKSFVPKTEIDSPRYDSLVKSATKIKKIESLMKSKGVLSRPNLFPNTRNSKLRNILK